MWSFVCAFKWGNGHLQLEYCFIILQRQKSRVSFPPSETTPFSIQLQHLGAKDLVHMTEALHPKDIALSSTVPFFCTVIGSTETFQALAIQIRRKLGNYCGPTDVNQTPFWVGDSDNDLVCKTLYEWRRWVWFLSLLLLVFICACVHEFKCLVSL